MVPEALLSLQPYLLAAGFAGTLLFGFVAGRRSGRKIQPSVAAPSRHHEKPAASDTELARRLDASQLELEIARDKLLEQERLLQRLTLFDPLTGLANRFLLAERIDHGIAKAKRHNAQVGILLIGIEGLQPINERFGKAIGDELLAGVAKRLRGVARSEDTVARLGADEFVIALEGVFEQDDLNRVKSEILRKLAEPFSIDEQAGLHLDASISCAFFPQDGASSENLLTAADRMMFALKKRRLDAAAPCKLEHLA